MEPLGFKAMKSKSHQVGIVPPISILARKRREGDAQPTHLTRSWIKCSEHKYSGSHVRKRTDSHFEFGWFCFQKWHLKGAH